MQQEPSKTSQTLQQRTASQHLDSSIQHGLLHHDASGSGAHPPQQPRSLPAGSNGPFDIHRVNASLLDQKLRGLNGREQSAVPASKPLGQRISEYENALTPSTPRQALGFKVVKRAEVSSNGAQLVDFPNEILTHILSHLHPDSHASVALVSKRFYSLVMTPHPWRMAFQRFFPGADALVPSRKSESDAWEEGATELVHSATRHFTRLSSQAPWRTEYLLRTRLLRSLARGKPSGAAGGIGASSRTSQSSKKNSAVLTYNSKLPSMVSNIHATFPSSGKKSPRMIHAAADLCVTSASDPTTGKVEKWGLDDPFAFAQLDEVVPHLLPYGVGEGPAAVPNVMDVSQPYGILGGEGFPGGRVFYRPSNEYRGKYLGQDNGVTEAYPEIPKIPELSEGVSAIWIAKSPSVPSATQTMIGMMTGSTLGVVTSYALGYDSSGSRYPNGAITARWVISPGVPIVALKVDDNYSLKRKALGRVWAVALNALGEIYYLTKPPVPGTNQYRADDNKLAWIAGRSTYWHLIEATRREARPDESGRNAVRGTYSPRSPSSNMNLTKDQMVAEAREIERFLRYKPAHFRKVCHGWDMRRRIEVDFAMDDGESIFLINCGIEEEHVSSITRFCRIASPSRPAEQQPALSPETKPEHIRPGPSIFGGSNEVEPFPDSPGLPQLKQETTSVEPLTVSKEDAIDEWRETPIVAREIAGMQITISSIDASLLATTTSFEDPLCGTLGTTSSTMPTLTDQAVEDIPGRRARLFGVGTNSGMVLLWNMRATHLMDGIEPCRVIQTESPEISSLAISALYVVHGGSDGLLQAWDPLASTTDAIRTLNSRSQGRLPRHLLTANPALRHANFSAVGAIFLDPDPTILRGVVGFGSSVRYWSYSSSGQATGRKRRVRHSDVHGRIAGRRHGGGVKGYIAAEAEELRQEKIIKEREQAHLRARFGVGLGELTEEEAIKYAEMMSQESFMLDEHRRTSASDTGSTADFDTNSFTDSLGTVTPDPSIAGRSPQAADISSNTAERMSAPDEESDYELQIQAALRLSLLESGVDDTGQSPKPHSSGELDFPGTYIEKNVGASTKGRQSPPPPPTASSRWADHVPLAPQVHNRGSFRHDKKPAIASASSSSAVPRISSFSYAAAAGSSSPGGGNPGREEEDVDDDDLQLALKLSLAEEESRQAHRAATWGMDFEAEAEQQFEGYEHSHQGGATDEFPPLEGEGPEGKGKGKGKSKTAW